MEQHSLSQVIETLHGSHRRGSHHNQLVSVFIQRLYRFSRNGYELSVHIVIADGFRLDRLEGAGTDMQCYTGYANTSLFKRRHHLGSKMEARRRSSHRSLHFGIDRLVGLVIARFGIAVQIRRNRQFPCYLQQFGKGHFRSVPRKLNHRIISVLGNFPGREQQLRPLHDDSHLQHLILPPFCVANHAMPGAASPLLEIFGIIAR
jgi:hypothetical protein